MKKAKELYALPSELKMPDGSSFVLGKLSTKERQKFDKQLQKNLEELFAEWDVRYPEWWKELYEEI